jgi:hypothetical protein
MRLQDCRIEGLQKGIEGLQEGKGLRPSPPFALPFCHPANLQSRDSRGL